VVGAIADDARAVVEERSAVRWSEGRPAPPDEPPAVDLAEVAAAARYIVGALDLDEVLAAVVRAAESGRGVGAARVELDDPDDPCGDRPPAGPRLGGPVRSAEAEADAPGSRQSGRGDHSGAGTPSDGEDVDPAPGVIAIPIRHGGWVIGVLRVSWLGPAPLPAQTLLYLGVVAAYAAIAIENARRHARAVEAARLDGVHLAARTAADQVGNDLMAMFMLADFAVSQLDRGVPIDRSVLTRVVDGARSGIQRMHKLLQVGRVETRRQGAMPPVLNLD
jgi:GAF domain-containing protein